MIAGSLGVPGERRVEQELRRLPEHLLGAELDRGSPEVLIRVARRHARRTGAVGLARDGAGDLRVLDLADDDRLLARLDVRADPDDELRIATEPLVGVDQGVGVDAHREEPRGSTAASFDEASPSGCGERRYSPQSKSRERPQRSPSSAGCVGRDGVLGGVLAGPRAARASAARQRAHRRGSPRSGPAPRT